MSLMSLTYQTDGSSAPTCSFTIDLIIKMNLNEPLRDVMNLIKWAKEELFGNAFIIWSLDATT